MFAPKISRRGSAAPIVDVRRQRSFRRKLRRWFLRHGRDLPWRATRDPYRVLVSELMLQQTQVSRVLTKYEVFLAAFPTLADVARAKPRQVMEAWTGLGYYARARHLHQLARDLTKGGDEPAATLPADPAALRTLPGIGAYTAGAVASFAYERRAELVDTNVARVLSRVFAPTVDLKSARGQKVVWEMARRILPRTGLATWTHNQALIELGALICTARVRRCGECPVARECRSGGARKGRRWKREAGGGKEEGRTKAKGTGRAMPLPPPDG